MTGKAIWKGELLDRLRELAANPAKYTCAQMAEIISRETQIAVGKNAIIGACNRNKIIIAGSDKGGRRANSQKRKRGPRTKQTRFWKPKPEADMEIQLTFANVVPRNVEFMALDPHDCRYPTSEGPFLFCGNPVQAESSYCAGHHALCWLKPTKFKGHTYRDKPRKAA